MNKFSTVFNRLQSCIIGMVHVRALPGTPGSRHTVDEIVEIACKEASIYEKAKVDGVILENMFDTPWTLLSESSAPEVTAAMTAVAREVRKVCSNMAVGVQVLAVGNKQALAVAKAAGLNFIRAEGFVYSHIADEGLVNSCAGELLRYRKQIGADEVLIFTDVKKKHCSHSITADVDLVETAKTAELFKSDGLIVTGKATGDTTDPYHLRDVQNAVNIPVLVGSGVTVDNLEDYMSANAMIIGSYFKMHGQWQNDLDKIRLNHFMNKLHKLRKKVDDSEDSQPRAYSFTDLYHEGH